MTGLKELSGHSTTEGLPCSHLILPKVLNVKELKLFERRVSKNVVYGPTAQAEQNKSVYCCSFMMKFSATVYLYERKCHRAGPSVC